MSEQKIQLNDVTKLEGLHNVDFSNGFVCDLETGICGPADEIENKKEEKEDKEKKNENHHLV